MPEVPGICDKVSIIGGGVAVLGDEMAVRGDEVVGVWGEEVLVGVKRCWLPAFPSTDVLHLSAIVLCHCSTGYNIYTGLYMTAHVIYNATVS